MIMYNTQGILRKTLKKNVRRCRINVSKHDQLWHTQDFKKNICPWAIMCQDMIIYETQKILRKFFEKNLPPCTIIYQNTIVYETQKILRKNKRPGTIMDRNTIIYEIQKILRKNIHPWTLMDHNTIIYERWNIIIKMNVHEQ